MDILTIIFTSFNAALTFISVTCAISSVKQTRKQTEIMQKQLEASLEPDHAINGKLSNIANAIYEVKNSIDNK